MLKVSIIISNQLHPIYPVVKEWVLEQNLADIELVNKIEALPSKGDFLFLVSCSEIITEEVRSRFGVCLLLHASDLPKGRGWSPHIWNVIEGAGELTLSLLEANDKVDTGKVWFKEKIQLDGTELFDEINKKVFDAELKLIEATLNDYGSIIAEHQDTSIKPSYYRKRTPEDSKLDVDKTIREQFNLLRVSDNERFPAFFEISGAKYIIKLEKAKSEI